MNNNGQMFMMNLLMLIMTIMVMVALMPALKEILDNVQQSDGLNCNGYVYNGAVNHALSYNSSKSTNTMACLAIKLYLPYILLTVLIAGVGMLIVGRAQGGQQNYGGY